MVRSQLCLEETRMAILIKCNESHLTLGNEQTFTLRKKKGVGLTRGQEAFIWVSERPREGRPQGASGLRMRGEVTEWGSASGGRTIVSVRITQELPDGVGVRAFSERDSEVARNLHRSIASYRHCLNWELTSDQRRVLDEVFETR